VSALQHSSAATSAIRPGEPPFGLERADVAGVGFERGVADKPHAAPALPPETAPTRPGSRCDASPYMPKAAERNTRQEPATPSVKVPPRRTNDAVQGRHPEPVPGVAGRDGGDEVETYSESDQVNKRSTSLIVTQPACVLPSPPRYRMAICP